MSEVAKERVYEMELVIKDCTKVFADGFVPGGFAKQTVTFKATDKEVEGPMFGLAVIKKGEDFLAENVKVVIREVPVEPKVEKPMPPEREVVQTNIGPCFQLGGLWFKQGARMALKNQERVTTWEPMPTKVFTVGASVRGGLGSSFQFENEAALEAWKENEFKALEATYGKLELSVYALPGLKVGDTCCVYGEGDEEFVIKELVQFSPHRYGFVLDSGWREEVGKCYRPGEDA